MPPSTHGPTQLSPARIRLALFALALGGFAIGSTEFVAMGLLPNLAADLLPGLYAAQPDVANAQAGRLISAYALGVVVGAPTIAVAGIFALTFLAVALVVPFQAGNPHSSIRRELRALGRRQVWLALLIGAIGFGGLFAVYTYVSPLVMDVTGLAALSAQFLAGLLAGVFLVGAAAAALGPTIQTRLMDVAHDSQSIAAALHHSALNVGNALGAYLGGVAIAAGLGYVAPVWIGLGLSGLGILLAVVTFAIDRSRRRLGVHVPYGTAAIMIVPAT